MQVLVWIVSTRKFIMKYSTYYVTPHQKNYYIKNDNISKPVSSPYSTQSLGISKVHHTENLLENFIAGKLRILEKGINQITEDIDERQKLHDKLLEEINKELCGQKSLLFQVAPNGSAPFTIGDPRRRGTIEKEIASLKGEKRREETLSWKDITTLKKELRLLFREYYEEKQRQQVIGT